MADQKKENSSKSTSEQTNETTELADKALGFFKKASEVIKNVASEVSDNYEGSDAQKVINEKSKVAGEVISEASKEVKKVLDEKGVTQAVNDVSDYTGDKLDTVSGTKILELVEQRLELQTKYNDILATKLEEALNRIAELEKKNS